MTSVTDLEVIAVEGGVGPALGSPARRHRLGRFGAAGLVMVLFVAFPVRSQLTRSELLRLEHEWLVSQAMDTARMSVINNELRAAAGPDDTLRLIRAFGALDHEEAAGISSIRHHVTGRLIVDPGLARLRAAVAHALTLESADLEQVARFYAGDGVSQQDLAAPDERSTPTLSAIGRVEVLLAGQLARFSLPLAPAPVVPRPRAADAALAAFGHILDEPTGTRLVAIAGGRPVLIDVDANRVEESHLIGLPFNFTPATVMVRRTYVVLGSDNQSGLFFAGPISLAGTVTPLGHVLSLAAATDPDLVWLQRSDGTAVEVDGHSRVRAGPVQLPAGSLLEGTVDAGLVFASGPSTGTIDVWDPTTRRVVRHITDANQGLVTAGRDTVVWVEGKSFHAQTVHLTTVSTGLDRHLPSKRRIQPTGEQWTFSPDGNTIASAWWLYAPGAAEDSVLYVPGFIDVLTGQLHLLPAPAALPPPAPNGITWSPSGDRIFITNNGGGQGGAGIVTYRLGASAMQHLRLRNGVVFAAVAAT